MITNLTDEQLAKLPKRVQQEIERLIANVHYWKAQATAGPADSNTFVRRSYDDGGRQPLGRGEPVEFHSPRGVVEVRVTDRGVEAYSPGGVELLVQPRHSNQIELVTR